jgi:sterol desaturase/sphingolipid hydroxylase (fatty acid hydroxylase superfamily)
MGLGYLGVSLVFGNLVWWTTVRVYTLRVLTLPETVWIAVVLILAEDFIYYWFHRLSHERRIWWLAHVNHHSSECYNLSTALRQPWTSTLVLTWALWLPLAFIGFDPRWIFFQKSINLLYQYWIHTRIIDKMPKLFEMIFNTPSHHRVHHGSNPEYLDRNYAGIFIIWDKLFGTFAAEDLANPVRYGLTKNLKTYNLIQVAFHEWFGVIKDFRLAGGYRQRLKIIFGPPR